MPIPAIRVRLPVPPAGEHDNAPTPEDILLQSTLTPQEQHYFRSLRKRDRTGLKRMLSQSIGARPAAGVPLRIQVLQSRLPEAMRLKIFEEMRTATCNKFTQWVRKVLELPIDSPCASAIGKKPLNHTIQDAQAAMDRVISGHDHAKSEVLKMVCHAHGGGSGAPAYSLGLEGAPGTGKTHFVRNAVPAALGRPIVSICLGGATDVTYLLGNIYTYEGSREGRIAAALMQSKCSNPIIHFDEVDKISTTDRGAELAAVLLHLVDPTMNTAIRDRYFHDIDLDLSSCCFVFTYNDASKVSPILLDRIKRVRMETPTAEMRAQITTTHIVPRIRTRLGIGFALSDGALEYLLEGHSAGGDGMRGIEKDADHILAEAQLALALAGKDVEKRADVLDDQGAVSAKFARTRLIRKDSTDWANVAAMYT